MPASDDNGRSPHSPSFSHAEDIVELVVLTSDEAFLRTLRDALGNSRRVWHVASADQVGDLLVAGQVGILVVDAQALYGATPIFIERIKRQFPDLVLLGAGNRDDESALANFISEGAVFRFIHKPVSPARARLFADAAVRRFSELRQRVAPTLPATPGTLRRPALLRFVGVLLLAGVLLAAVITWTLRQGSSRERRLASTLALAAERLQEGRLTDPEEDSAKFYVQAALRIDPSSRAALTAEDTLARALLFEAHIAIDHHDFARAVSLLDAADGIASQASVEKLLRLLRTARREAAARRARNGLSAQPDS